MRGRHCNIPFDLTQRPLSRGDYCCLRRKNCCSNTAARILGR